MDTTLEYDKKHVRKPAFIALVFCGIPFVLLVCFYDYWWDDVLDYQIYFGYLWIWCLGLTLYWRHKKVISTTFEYMMAILGLILNATFILFLPYIFS